MINFTKKLSIEKCLLDPEKSPIIEIKLWILTVKFIKIDLPFLKMVKKYSNIVFNQKLDLLLPNFLPFLADAKIFFEGTGEIFTNRKSKKKYPVPPLPVVNISFDVHELQQNVLTAIHNVMLRHPCKIIDGVEDSKKN